MKSKQNLHTHCTYCDGHSSMEEIIQSAIKSGLSSIGFSSHCYTDYPCDYCHIELQDIDSYFSEIASLKKKYCGQISIFAGFEYESTLKNQSLPDVDPRCDFFIGSTHYLKNGKDYWTLDYRSRELKYCAENFGSFNAMCEKYFENTVNFIEAKRPDIIGHFDLITKFIEVDPTLTFFKEKWYKDMCLAYLDKAIALGGIFEVNTGAISRNYRTSPYPDSLILNRIKEKHAEIIITSDSHRADTLTFKFEETEDMLRSLGFNHQMMLTENGFTEVPL